MNPKAFKFRVLLVSAEQKRKSNRIAAEFAEAEGLTVTGITESHNNQVRDMMLRSKKFAY